MEEEDYWEIPSEYLSQKMTKQENYTGIELEPHSKKIWKNILYVSSLMAVLIPLILYPFAEDPTYKIPLFAATIISILLSGISFFMTKGIRGYYVVESDKKQIAYYQEFHNNITVRPIADFKDVKRVEIRIEELFHYNDEGASSYENIFSLVIVFKNGQHMLISDEESERVIEGYLIGTRNIARLTFPIDEITKSELCNLKFKSKEQLILELKNNFKFTKDQIMEILYSPPEGLKRNGEKIANLIGCQFLPIGRTRLYGSHESYLFIVDN